MFGYESLSAAAFADDAVDSTVGITAVTGTGSVGTVGVSHTQAVTGNTGTGSVGSVSFVYTQPVTAVTTTGSVGTVSMGTRTVALTSVTGTGSVGTVVASDVEQEDSVTGTGSVNLSANRFNATFAPRVIATVISTAGTATSVTIGTPTYNAGTGIYNVPLYTWTGASASTVARTVQVAAFQMLSGAANG